MKKQEQKKNNKKKRTILLATLIPLGAAAVATAVTVPLVLKKKDSQNQNEFEFTWNENVGAYTFGTQAITLKADTLYTFKIKLNGDNCCKWLTTYDLTYPTKTTSDLFDFEAYREQGEEYNYYAEGSSEAQDVYDFKKFSYLKSTALTLGYYGETYNSGTFELKLKTLSSEKWGCETKDVMFYGYDTDAPYTVSDEYIMTWDSNKQAYVLSEGITIHQDWHYRFIVKLQDNHACDRITFYDADGNLITQAITTAGAYNRQIDLFEYDEQYGHSYEQGTVSSDYSTLIRTTPATGSSTHVLSFRLDAGSGTVGKTLWPKAYYQS